MIKVCFISWHFQNPEVFLQNIIKMTPGKSGIWKDMQAVIDPKKADFCAVFDGTNVSIPMERSLFFGEHPACLRSYREWEEINALKKFPLKKYLNPGEWWLDYDYDYLSSLKNPAKTKDLICIFTAQDHTPIYAKRKNFVKCFCEVYPAIHLYGRPEANFKSDAILKKYYRGVLGVVNPKNVLGDHQVGKELLIDYKYSLEFDVGPTINYISERFYDAMLLWTMPFYFGSSNVHEYLPSESFHYIDMDADVQAVIEVMQGNYYEKNLEALAAARDLLLNKYQIWPYVYNAIKAL